jgi:hypothetical protein
MILRHVMRWQNGMVMAFDENGQQIPALQGRYDDVRHAVLAAADANTVFSTGIWSNGADDTMSGRNVSREEW